MKTVKVSNLTSPRTGNPVANQFNITVGKADYFQSYDTIIAYYGDKGLMLDTGALDYSRTTSKYLYQFTNMNRKELQEYIDKHPRRVKDLNKCKAW